MRFLEIRVLVIDDNNDIREVLAVYLEHEKIEYKLIDNGVEGLEAIEKDDYDLIFLDIQSQNLVDWILSGL